MKPCEVTPWMRTALRLAVDGSYATNNSSAAAIIEHRDNPVHQIIFPIRTPANLHTVIKNDSYHAETSGILAGLKLLGCMEILTNSYTSITISWDNVQALATSKTYEYSDAHNKHFDIVRGIIHTRNSLTSQLHYQQVKGHSDHHKSISTLTRTELLNRECDLLAKSARICLQAIPPNENDQPGEGLSVWLNSEVKIYTDFSGSLYSHIMDTKAKKVMMQKYAWTPREFSSVDWEAISLASTYLNPSTRQ